MTSRYVEYISLLTPAANECLSERSEFDSTEPRSTLIGTLVEPILPVLPRRWKQLSCYKLHLRLHDRSSLISTACALCLCLGIISVLSPYFSLAHSQCCISLRCHLVSFFLRGPIGICRVSHWAIRFVLGRRDGFPSENCEK